MFFNNSDALVRCPGPGFFSSFQKGKGFVKAFGETLCRFMVCCLSPCLGLCPGTLTAARQQWNGWEGIFSFHQLLSFRSLGEVRVVVFSSLGSQECLESR